jgi:NADH-quinone oxidoreductase subunit L
VTPTLATLPLAAIIDAAPAGGAFSSAWLLVALPLAGAAVLLLAGRRADPWGHWLGVLASAAAFVVGLVLLIALLGRDASERVLDVHLFRWLPTGDFAVDAGLRIDPLSLTFVMLVTFVGTLIHVYSVAYMEHDADRRRFFAYLNLFVAAMLVLVLADSYLLLFFGWEGVGLASYLLIGFWNHHTPNAVAAKKAFIANRIGDLGLLVALMIMVATFGAVDFDTVLGAAPEAGEGTLTALGLVLLLAACGKSAQFPLQSWLGDAMAGPTPVSALIHAATMVTAGVYLVARSNPIFDAAPDARLAVVVVGAVTLLFGAIVGCAKDDIKKALAASTMSQIGYMVLAAGLGPAGYAFAIIHLLTHGFFKAGMFLGAGSVMHGMNDEIDMRRYGGLARHMPITAVTFGLGYLAIIGVPPFAGFFSKDKIIEAAFGQHWVYGAAALLGAGITAFYMSRVMLMTFFGTRRWADDAHPHESPPVMTVPMILLAVGSVGAGAFLVLGNRLVHWLEPVVGEEEHALPVPVWVITAATLAAVLSGVALAYAQYARREVPVVAPAGSFATVAARKDLYQDAVSEAVFMRPGQYATRSLVYVDNRGIDGAVNGLAAAFGGSSGRLRRLQTGFVRSYALSMLGGAAFVVATLLLMRIS